MTAGPPTTTLLDATLVVHAFVNRLTLPAMGEMSGAEQRYKAVPALIADGRTVTEVAKDASLMPMRAWRPLRE